MAGVVSGIWQVSGGPLGSLGLLAQMPAGVSFLQTIATLFTLGVFTGIWAGVKWWIENRQKTREVDRTAEQKARGDALVEWKDYAAKLEKDGEAKDAVIAKRDAQRDKLVDKIGRQQQTITGLQARFDTFQAANDALSRGHDPFLVALMTHPSGYFITEADGTITDCGPNVRAILHYFDNELVGQNVSTLIPPEFQAAHAAFMAKARDELIPLDPENALPLILIAKEGTRIPVYVRVDRWKDRARRLHFTANICQRRLTPDLNGGNGGSHSGDSGAFLKAGDPAGERETKEMPQIAGPGPAKRV